MVGETRNGKPMRRGDAHIAGIFAHEVGLRGFAGRRLLRTGGSAMPRSAWRTAPGPAGAHRAACRIAIRQSRLSVECIIGCASVVRTHCVGLLVRFSVDPAVENGCEGDERSIPYRHVAGNALLLLVAPPEKIVSRNQIPSMADRNTEPTHFKNGFSGH